MKTDLNIDIHHLTRIEGHGNIVVRIEKGELKEARWDAVETPRYFEVLLRGKHYTSTAVIASRICGICSISHSLASLRATEDAFGLEIPETAKRLRLLAKHAETLQSHYLHVLFLAAPDFLGLTSVLPLLETKPEVVAMAARLKGMSNRICDAVAGRTTHPISLTVGGVSTMPSMGQLQAFREELRRSFADIEQIAGLVETFEIPDFERETEFVSLKAEESYPFIGGSIVSSDGVERNEREYRQMSNEYVDDRNTTKWTKLSRDSYAVGALARFNNNHTKLHIDALKTAMKLGLKPVCHNPFMNNVAQVAEIVHCTHEAITLIDDLLESDPRRLRVEVEPRAGKGVGAVEAPRGILMHEYEYDAEGRVLAANCVVPTTQNNANIHLDLGDLVRQFSANGVERERLELLCAMLVRSYDPCVSCSVH